MKTTCKRCGTEGLTWHQQDGRWVLLTAEGAAHGKVCDKLQSSQLTETTEKKKAGYARIKAEADWHDKPTCLDCGGIGTPPGIQGLNMNGYYNRCRACNGSGRWGDETKRRYLYLKRKAIWPSMFKKREKAEGQ